jgi:hypothetical protein
MWRHPFPSANSRKGVGQTVLSLKNKLIQKYENIVYQKRGFQGYEDYFDSTYALVRTGWKRPGGTRILAGAA